MMPIFSAGVTGPSEHLPDFCGSGDVVDAQFGVGELTGDRRWDVRLVHLRPQPLDPRLSAERRVLVLQHHGITVDPCPQAERGAVQNGGAEPVGGDAFVLAELAQLLDQELGVGLAPVQAAVAVRDDPESGVLVEVPDRGLVELVPVQADGHRAGLVLVDRGNDPAVVAEHVLAFPAVERVEDGALGPFLRRRQRGVGLQQVQPDRADHRVVAQAERVAAAADAVRPDELRHPGREVRAVREAVEDVPAVLQVAPDPRRFRESGVRRHDVGVPVEVVGVVHQRRTFRSTRLRRRRITRAGLRTAWPTR